MLDLKGIYLNFLSIKKITFKSIRQLFFSTSFYNKLLTSENPNRFFFYPNPYLLSPLLNQKDLLLKISKFEANYFWNKSKNINETKNLHSFLWLNLIDRAMEGDSISLEMLYHLWETKVNPFLPPELQSKEGHPFRKEGGIQ